MYMHSGTGVVCVATVNISRYFNDATTDKQHVAASCCQVSEEYTISESCLPENGRSRCYAMSTVVQDMLQ